MTKESGARKRAKTRVRGRSAATRFSRKRPTHPVVPAELLLPRCLRTSTPGGVNARKSLGLGRGRPGKGSQRDARRMYLNAHLKKKKKIVRERNLDLVDFARVI